MQARQLLKRIFRAAGKELRDIDTPTRSFSRSMEMLSKLIAPATVIDIGVADGTPELYHFFPKQRYLLVEANPCYADQLKRLGETLNAAVENVFCGAQVGTATLNVYTDRRKSSLFSTHLPVKLTEQIQVPVMPLDELVVRHRLPSPYLVKIDVEGAELEVIRGAATTLRASEAVIAEASILPRFAGAPEFAELVKAMADAGFSVFDIVAGYNQRMTGYLQQVDLVFVRTQARFRQPNAPGRQ